MTVMNRPRPEQPDDIKKNNETLSMKVIRWSDLSIDELLSIRKTLKDTGEDLTVIDKELRSRII
jgi:hypothetical protein